MDGKEIERKFLMTEEQFKQMDILSFGVMELTQQITQGYIVNREDIVVRLRIEQQFDGEVVQGAQGIICIKKPVDGSTVERFEDEYEIDLYMANNLIRQLSLIEKARYTMGPYTFDVFDGNLAGLILVEREYDTVEEAEADPTPPWVVREVTSDPTYLNSCLIDKHYVDGGIT